MSVKTGHFSHVSHMVFHIHTPSSDKQYRILFYIFKGYRCNELSVITPKKILMRARESKCQISQHDVLHMNFSEFTYVFL